MTAWVGVGESTRSPVEKDLQFWKVLFGQRQAGSRHALLTLASQGGGGLYDACGESPPPPRFGACRSVPTVRR